MSASEEEKKPNVAGGLVIVALCVGLAIWMMAKDPFGGTLSESLLIGLVFAALFAIYYGVRLMGADRLLSGIAAFFLFSGGIHAGDLMSQDGCIGADGGGEECEDPLPEPEIASVDGKSDEAPALPQASAPWALSVREAQASMSEGPDVAETVAYIEDQCIDAKFFIQDSVNLWDDNIVNSVAYSSEDSNIIVEMRSGIREDFDVWQSYQNYNFDIEKVHFYLKSKGNARDSELRVQDNYVNISCFSGGCIEYGWAQDDGKINRRGSWEIACSNPGRVVRAFEHLQELSGGARRNDPFAK